MEIDNEVPENSEGKKVKRKIIRFNGIPEEELVQRTLPDLLIPDLDIVIIGINPGLTSAFRGHHYAGPSNHFWKCLNLSGLTPEPMTADDDFKLLQYGIGFTNVVERTTKGSGDLHKGEYKSGFEVLFKKLQTFRPKIAVFNGKMIYEVFAGKKNFQFGLQPGFVEGTNTYIWVMPSSSARSAHLPSPKDKLPFYNGLKNFRDCLNSGISDIKVEEFAFPIVSRSPMKKEKEIKSEYFVDSVQSAFKDSGRHIRNVKRRLIEEDNDIETNLKVLRLMCKR